jgi:glycine/D-amino acid oxidase-like deaminating enzyme
MKIRILGAGFYGCHIGLALRRAGHNVVIHEIKSHIFAGASGAIPARLHIGCHYPRSRLTRAACLDHREAFMTEYGALTRAVPINLYAIAADHSLIDFDQYVQTLRNEIEFLTVSDPAEFGLRNVEGAIQVGERHIVTDRARAHFEKELGNVVKCNTAPGEVDSAEYDWTIDCTFCANDSAGVDRWP